MLIFSSGFNDTTLRGGKIGVKSYEMSLDGKCVIGGNHVKSHENYQCVSDSILSGCKDVSIPEILLQEIDSYARSKEGILGFILFDTVSKVVDVVGDYLGRVPLYYYNKKNLLEDRFLVASEMKCFYGLPTKDVHLLGMGEWLHYENGKLSITSYYKVPRVSLDELHNQNSDKVNLCKTDEEAVANTKSLLEMGVKHCVYNAEGLYNAGLGDMCVFLSGGVDSTVVAAIAKQLKPDLVAYTFSVGDESKNDLYFARLAAERLGIELREVVVSKEDVFEHLNEVVYFNEDSSWTQITSAVGQYFLAKEASKDGFKVALCGDMSDEIYASYPQIERWSWRDEQYVVARDRLISKAWVNANRSVKVLRGAGNMLYFDPYTFRPFLTFASNVPPKYKDGRLDGKRVNKWLLRSAFADVIPKEIAIRPKGCQGTVTNVDELFGEKEKQMIKDTYERFFNHEGRIADVKF